MDLGTKLHRTGNFIMQTRIPQSIRYDREQSIEGTDNLFLSTIFPPDKPLLKGSNLDDLIEEITYVNFCKSPSGLCNHTEITELCPIPKLGISATIKRQM